MKAAATTIANTASGKVITNSSMDIRLSRVSAKLSALRIQRDKLIREHPGTLREIALAAGLSHQQVANIKAKEEK